jgi:exonuclease SbcC
MIPIRLSLKNFMPYRDNVPPLSFEGFHVACLTGENGHGKSAIFDAITWALWGKSRAKSDDELVHIGQSDMMVEFDFAVGGQRYKVIRKLSKSASGRSSVSPLDLLIESKDGFRNISGDTKTETEKKITGILRMDYDTFINSAFLVQGRAAEFTTRRPAERKEVLGNILGLSFYDDLAKAARDRENERQRELETLASAVGEIERQLAAKPADEAALASAVPALKSVQERCAAADDRLSALRRDNEALNSRRQQLADLGIRLSGNRRELQEQQTKADSARRRLEELKKLGASAADIESGYSRLVEARRSESEAAEKLRLVSQIDRQLVELEKAVIQARSRLEAAVSEAARRIRELDTKSSSLPSFESALAVCRSELEKLSSREQAWGSSQEKLTALARDGAALQQEVQRLEADLKASREKLDLLAHGDSRCPLCESVLGGDGLEKLRHKLASEQDALVKSHDSSEESVKATRKDYGALNDALKRERSALDVARSRNQSESARLEKEIKDAARAAEDAAGLRGELDMMKSQLSGLQFAVVEQEQIARLEKEKQAVGYDAAAHKKASTEVAGLLRYESLHQQAQQAAREIAAQDASLKAAAESLEKLAAAVAGDESAEKTLKSGVDALSGIPSQLARAEDDRRRLNAEEQALREQVAALSEKMRSHSGLEAQKQEKEGRTREVAEEAGVYKQLDEAFGKKGVQAILIDAALPEITDEANRLLSRMTDGRMALLIDTQRDTKSKKGGIIETLDIRISDELGTRNYEMFSGGEAFRINLALRIALSRLLVNRAGASLPILIIDEGFGTQDSAGREKLVEAIKSIQDEFRKIIVITHLEDLKDAFPVRINVTKTGLGSMIEVG